MKNKIALKIALIYFLIGFLWILFSDQFLLTIAQSEAYLTILQTYKGWFFVSITATLLFFLVRNEIMKKNQVEEHLIKAKLKAEESDLLKSAFLSNMSHEIRTPLNGILGFCELILDDSFDNEDKKIFAKNLEKNGNDFLKLINDIMDISKIQENQLDLSKKVIKLNDLLSNIYQEYQDSDQRKANDEVEFNLIFDKDDLEIVLFSDPERFSHIFRNLLNNAFFFTKKGYINFGYQATHAGIELFVEDSGCGIDESSQEQLFKPFFKGKNMIVGNKGFGLGLAISKGLVKLLGSDLQYKSTAEKGSRFYFRIENKDIVSRKASSTTHTMNAVKMKTISYNSNDNLLSQN